MTKTEKNEAAVNPPGTGSRTGPPLPWREMTIRQYIDDHCGTAVSQAVIEDILGRYAGNADGRALRQYLQQLAREL